MWQDFMERGRMISRSSFVRELQQFFPVYSFHINFSQNARFCRSTKKQLITSRAIYGCWNVVSTLKIIMQRKETLIIRENLEVKARQLNLRHISERSERPCTSNSVPMCSAPSPAAPPLAVGHTALLSEVEERTEWALVTFTALTRRIWSC